MMAGAAAAYTAVDKKSILIFAASAMLAAIFAKITSRGPRLLLAAAAGAVLVFVTLWSYGNLGLGAYQGREVTVRGIVVSAAPRDDGSLVLSCVVSPFEKVRVRYTGDLSLQRLAGSTIEFSGTPATPERAGNPGCYERRRYLYGQGFSREFYVSDICCREKRGILGRYINTAVRCREGFLDRCFTESEAAAFARGVLFGRADMMDEETLNAFRRNGTAHILAVSGLHIGIIFACWDFVRKKLKLTTAVPFVVFLLFYGTAVMWPSSVIRATATIALKIAGEGLNRRFDMASAMALITILMMIKKPMVVLDTGTIMSFLAVSGIYVFDAAFQKNHVAVRFECYGYTCGTRPVYGIYLQLYTAAFSACEHTRVISDVSVRALRCDLFFCSIAFGCGKCCRGHRPFECIIAYNVGEFDAFIWRCIFARHCICTRVDYRRFLCVGFFVRQRMVCRTRAAA